MAALLAVALTALLLAAAACASGPEVYVSPSGSDDAPGTSSAPFATISKALVAVSSGGTIRVAPGTYPSIRDMAQHSTTVTLEGWNGRPTLGGLTLVGASNVEVRGIDFDGPIMVSNDVFQHVVPTEHVVLADVDVTAPGQTCVTFRSGSRDITLQDSHVHDCITGLGGPPATPNVDGVQILRNRFEHFTGDAVQFGDWDNVVLDRNVIHDMHDPTHVIHNDGIQFTGGSSHVKVTNNILYDSQGQLLFVQDSFGPIDDVLAENNLIHDADAYAVQLQGATNVRFIGNTVWHSGFGGVLVREGQRGGATTQVVPTDTVVRGNIVPALSTDGIAQLAIAADNSLRCPATSDVPCADDTAFANVAQADYRLRAESAQFIAGVGYRPPADAPSGDDGSLPPSATPSPTPTPSPTVTPPPTMTPAPTVTPAPTAPVTTPQPSPSTTPRAATTPPARTPGAGTGAQLPASEKAPHVSGAQTSSKAKRGTRTRRRSKTRHAKHHSKKAHKGRDARSGHGKRRNSTKHKKHRASATNGTHRANQRQKRGQRWASLTAVRIAELL